MRGIALSDTCADGKRLVSESFSAMLEVSVHSQAFRKSLIEAAVLPSLLQQLLFDEAHVGVERSAAAPVQGLCTSGTK